MSLLRRFIDKNIKTIYAIRRANIHDSIVMKNAIKNVTVIGGGLMGSGIAQVAAQTGHAVTVVEVNNEALTKAKANIENSLRRVAKKKFKDDAEQGTKYVQESLSKIKLSLDMNNSVKDSDLVIEAIVENLETKHKLFGSIDSVASDKTIFASNTSSLPIGDIARITKRKDRFVGLHFFNPVPVMKLLEVVRTPDTSDDTWNKAWAFGQAMGKVTVACKDTPGFIVNRLLVPFIGEAFKMLERGDASAKDIDTSMKLGAGHPMGPLELADYVGHDTTYFILKGWSEKFPDNELFKPTKTLKKLVDEGKLGVKTGEGIYKYDKKM